jgi:hypothetical protein
MQFFEASPSTSCPVQVRLPLQLGARRSSITALTDSLLRSGSLSMHPTYQSALIDSLLTRRYIGRRVSLKEVHGLQTNLQYLDRHDWEILNPGHMVDPELNPYDNILVVHLVFAISPRAYTSTATRLVRVPAASVELAVGVTCDVDGMVGEFGALEVEGVRMREDGLEGRSVDFVSGGLAVDGVAGRGGKNFEDAVVGWRQI